MASVLKADGSAADAYVQVDFAAESDVYVTLDLILPATHAAAIVGDLGYGPNFVALLDSGNPDPNDQGMLTIPDGSDVGLQLNYDAAVTVFASPFSSDVAHTIEMRVQAGTPAVTSVWVDGVSQTVGMSNPHAGGYVGCRFGLLYAASDPRQVYYLDNLKIGTTRGGTELFSEDFEGATPLANFDSTSGDVSVVTDPLASEEVADPIGICIAFDDDTLEPEPVWTRIDDPEGYRLATSYTIRRGRQSELDKTGTGTATIACIDKDGTLDPTNPSGPFYGKLDPMKQAAIALHHPVLDTWHTIFRGFVSEWLYDMDVSGDFANVTLELADAFDLLAALEMTPGNVGDTTPAVSEGDIYFAETSGGTPGAFTRFNQALDDAGWPSELRSIFTGNIHLQGTVYARRDQLLTVLFDTADAELPGLANVFMSKIGWVTFQGRYARFEPEDPDYQINFWPSGGRPQADADPTVAPIAGLNFRRSKNDIINAAIALPQGVDDSDVPTSLVKDDTSIGKFGWRSISFDNLLTLFGRAFVGEPFDINAVDETKLYADFYVNNFKDPRTRVERIIYRSRDPQQPWAEALWDVLCKVDISDIVPLETTHPGGGGFDEDFYVEGISYTVEPKTEGPTGGFPDVTLELDVSPRSFYENNPFGPSGSGSESEFGVFITEE